MTGRIVNRLFDGYAEGAVTELNWNTSTGGRSLARGVYFVRAEFDNAVHSVRLNL